MYPVNEIDGEGVSKLSTRKHINGYILDNGGNSSVVSSVSRNLWSCYGYNSLYGYGWYFMDDRANIRFSRNLPTSLNIPITRNWFNNSDIVNISDISNSFINNL